MEVPNRIKMGQNVTLSCFFEMETESSLYSLNWWKDNEQFYQYSPNHEREKQIVYETLGVFVDVSLNIY